MKKNIMIVMLGIIAGAMAGLGAEEYHNGGKRYYRLPRRNMAG